MLWLILSLLTAFAVASQDAWVKKYFSHLTAYDMLAFPFLYSLPLFMFTIPFIPVPPLDDTFYWCFLILSCKIFFGSVKLIEGCANPKVLCI